MTRSSTAIAAVVGAAGLALSWSFAASTPAAAQDKVKVFVSAGFEGNTWMDASLNLISAMAKTKEYADRVEFDV